MKPECKDAAPVTMTGMFRPETENKTSLILKELICSRELMFINACPSFRSPVIATRSLLKLLVNFRA